MGGVAAGELSAAVSAAALDHEVASDSISWDGSTVNELIIKDARGVRVDKRSRVIRRSMLGFSVRRWKPISRFQSIRLRAPCG
jgi:hypothetical protein